MLSASDPSPDPLAGLAGWSQVADAVPVLRQEIDRLRSHRAMRRRGAAIRDESLIRGAAAMAGLVLGRTVSVDEARACVTTEDADAVVRGAVRAYAAVGELGPVWRVAPLQALARLHTLAARELAAVDELGRPKGQPAADRLTTLAGVLRATRSPALVVAAVVHGELAALAPFGSADVVVASVATRLVLADRGLDPDSLVAFEVALAGDPARYREHVDQYVMGSFDGVAAWIGYIAEMLTAGVQEALAIAESLARA